MATASKGYKVVGTSPMRGDGIDKVTGRAQFGADVNLPGMLYAKVLRSPHPHARIKSVDTSKAEAHPDVRAVITSADLADLPPAGPVAVMGQTPVDNILARGKALYKGHPIAAIAAENAHVAEGLLSLIEVEYEPLPACTNVEDAMSVDATPLHEDWPDNPELPGGKNVAAQDQYRYGDPDKGINQADHVIEREFRTRSVHQGYIEPQSATAWWAPEGRLTIWSSSQGHFAVRDGTAHLLGVPVSAIKVIPMEIGGGFGGKMPPYTEPLAALLSKKSGQPVKLSMDRADVLQGTGPTSGGLIRIKMGYTNDGRITGATAWFAFEAGAYPGAPLSGAASAVFASYQIDNVGVDGFDVVDNKPKTSAYRAPGAPIVIFCAESVVDEIARDLGMNAMEFRALNAAKEGTRRADGLINAVIGAEEVMQAVRDHPHYNAPLEQVEGKLRGRGTGMGFCRNNTGMSAVIANVLSDGTVSLVQGSMDLSGSRVAVAQQFAEVLGIPIADVNAAVGDTDSVGFTSVSGGSGVMYKTGWAAYEAAQDVIGQLKERAAIVWDTDADQVEYEDGELRHASDTELRMGFKEVAGMMARTGGPVVGRANINPVGAGGSYSANIVDVEIDPETGKVDLLRYTALQDVGTAVHLDNVEGQMQGGTVQGIGWALNEEYFMAGDGSMANVSLLDYRMPTILDLPMIDTAIVEVPNPRHPFGVRGVGEANISPPLAAIANAVFDATGVRMRNLPMNPATVLKALKEKE
ncbi:MAG: xanthine dehydrogenase family protein molybdopterin-binding subunit [SAR202 cluster bacterium]|nr:xanthine dehydrogenase family protein molybdopterin-binding subunit [SAR202 cluster bacterium]MDP6798471.1 xanthine dehydrogenase family protein molybdopterin-binding subunit [SAR202 cluster bacterium]MQG56318.1 xanthine dehydrogenase family protein molybdopterin-binding subunit [SAR202 cluster bacterium]MQG67239.1 xanthine dehydrogenase family protein molybdopterin-binding subunit [SAR202 cluster bacterium]